MFGCLPIIASLPSIGSLLLADSAGNHLVDLLSMFDTDSAAGSLLLLLPSTFQVYSTFLSPVQTVAFRLAVCAWCSQFVLSVFASN